MSLLLEEVKSRLKRYDEVILLEILEISSEDIIERFVDFIEDKLDELIDDLEEEDKDELSD